MAGPALKRLMAEYKQLLSNPPEGMFSAAFPSNGNCGKISVNCLPVAEQCNREQRTSAHY